MYSRGGEGIREGDGKRINLPNGLKGKRAIPIVFPDKRTEL
jgi:hypothetical protein